MVNEIGKAAGKVWTALHVNDGTMTYMQLKAAVRLDDFTLYAAIGWLARENKLTFTEDGVSL